MRIRDGLATGGAIVLIVGIVLLWPVIWVGDRTCGIRPYARLRLMIRKAWRSR